MRLSQVEERRRRNLTKAQQELLEAKRRAQEKINRAKVGHAAGLPSAPAPAHDSHLGSFQERIEYVESERELTMLEKRLTSELRDKERERVRQEAERRLQQRIQTYVDKEKQTEESLQQAQASAGVWGLRPAAALAHSNEEACPWPPTEQCTPALQERKALLVEIRRLEELNHEQHRREAAARAEQERERRARCAAGAGSDPRRAGGGRLLGRSRNTFVA